MDLIIKVFHFVICSFVIYGGREDGLKKIIATRLPTSLQEQATNFGERAHNLMLLYEEVPDTTKTETNHKAKQDGQNQGSDRPVDNEYNDDEKELSGSGEKEEHSTEEYIQSDGNYHEKLVLSDAPNAGESQENSTTVNGSTSNSLTKEKQNLTQPTAAVTTHATDIPNNQSTPTLIMSSAVPNNSIILRTLSVTVGGNSAATPLITQTTKVAHASSFAIMKRPVHTPVLPTTARTVYASSSGFVSGNPTKISTVQSTTIGPTGKNDGDVKNQTDPIPKAKKRKTLFGFVTVEILVALVAGAACAIILLAFLVHRLKKRNEGSYELQESLSLKAAGDDEKEVFV